MSTRMQPGTWVEVIEPEWWNLLGERSYVVKRGEHYRVTERKSGPAGIYIALEGLDQEYMFHTLGFKSMTVN